MRIQYQSLRNPRRTPLKDAVPLDTPMLVMLDPANACNLRCSFCPTGHADLRKMRPNGVMDWELYLHIVDGFKDMPHRVKQWTFCKDGEPLLNRHLVDMITLAFESEIADRLWLKTNGLLLSPALNTELARCGLDLIGVSVKAVSAEGYERVAGVRADYGKLVEMTADLKSKCGKTKVYASIVNDGLTDGERDQFFHDFEPVTDYCAVEDLHAWSMNDTTGFTKTTAVDTIVTPKVACPWPLFTLGINWNGQASACQEDWVMRNIVGDLRAQTVSEVWHSQERRAFLRTHLEGRRGELPACARCNYIEYCPDKIDDEREELLRRIT